MAVHGRDAGVAPAVVVDMTSPDAFHRLWRRLDEVVASSASRESKRDAALDVLAHVRDLRFARQRGCDTSLVVDGHRVVLTTDSVRIQTAGTYVVSREALTRCEYDAVELDMPLVLARASCTSVTYDPPRLGTFFQPGQLRLELLSRDETLDQ